MGFNQETLGTKRGFEQRKSGFHQQWEFSCGTLAPPTDITAISGRVGKCYSISSHSCRIFEIFDCRQCEVTSGKSNFSLAESRDDSTSKFFFWHFQEPSGMGETPKLLSTASWEADDFPPWLDWLKGKSTVDTSIFYGEKPWVSCRFSLKPSHWNPLNPRGPRLCNKWLEKLPNLPSGKLT